MSKPAAIFLGVRVSAMLELAVWVWVEHEILQSYASLFLCYNNKKEFLKFADSIYKMRKEGNTDENPVKSGFAAIQNTFN